MEYGDWKTVIDRIILCPIFENVRKGSFVLTNASASIESFWPPNGTLRALIPAWYLTCLTHPLQTTFYENSTYAWAHIRFCFVTFLARHYQYIAKTFSILAFFPGTGLHTHYATTSFLVQWFIFHMLWVASQWRNQSLRFILEIICVMARLILRLTCIVLMVLLNLN